MNSYPQWKRTFHWSQEVITLVCEEGLLPDSQAGRSIGYRQALEYLNAVWGFPGDKETGETYTAKVYIVPSSLSCIERTGYYPSAIAP